MGNEKSAMDVLVPKEKEIKIGGEVFVVKPFKVKDLVYFSREIQAAFISIKKKYPKLEFKDAETSMLLPLFLSEAERLIGLFARSIGKERIWLEDQADVVGFSALTACILYSQGCLCLIIIICFFYLLSFLILLINLQYLRCMPTEFHR